MTYRRTIQVALAVSDLALVTLWFWFSQSDVIHLAHWQEGILPTFGFIIWWTSPTAALFIHQTRAATIVTGLVLLVATTFGLISIYASTSSTAALGLYTLPVIGWLLAIMLVAGELLFRRF